MRHTNIPQAELIVGANKEEDLISPPPNSIRALLLKGKKNKLLVPPTTRQTYQTRLTQQQSYNVAGATASASCSNIFTPENFYEEISASSTSSSSNSRTSPQQLRTPSHLAGSLTRTLVEEELRRVQNRHNKILRKLNLSVEAMLMPESPPNSSPKAKEPPMHAVSVTTASGEPLRLTSSSAANIYDTALVGGPADDFISPIPNAATVSAGILQTSGLVSDLDSGFSGSSGASYIGSLRLHKTKPLMSSRSNNLSSSTTAAAGSNAVAKSQQSAFAYATQCCRSFQRANINNTNPHDDLHNSTGFFTRASCGCRILNCVKIRAAEDTGPVVLNAQPKESKAIFGITNRPTFQHQLQWC